MGNKPLVAFAVAILAATAAAQHDTSSSANPAQGGKLVSVSGVSSGAYMAAQLQVAFSETFMGVGSLPAGRTTAPRT